MSSGKFFSDIKHFHTSLHFTFEAVVQKCNREKERREDEKKKKREIDIMKSMRTEVDENSKNELEQTKKKQ